MASTPSNGSDLPPHLLAQIDHLEANAAALGPAVSAIIDDIVAESDGAVIVANIADDPRYIRIPRHLSGQSIFDVLIPLDEQPDQTSDSGPRP